MCENDKAREIQEGDWIIIGGAPYVFYEFRLMSTSDLVKHFQKIIEDWRQEYIKARDLVRKGEATHKNLERSEAYREELTETLRITQGELDKLKKETGGETTSKQRGMMRHALGLKTRGVGEREGERNYYCASSGCDGYDELVALVDMGMMIQKRSPVSEDFVFHVTDKGKAAL